MRLRKGLWSPDEDEKLRACIAQHSSGSWSDIARKAGLQRCGKSCRRRWMNHLRPDLKHEKFSEEEVRLIIKLHDSLGNKWSEIATYLVGRTDNDVKNLWNTQIKRQLKNSNYEMSSKLENFASSSGLPFSMDVDHDSTKNKFIDLIQRPISSSIPISNNIVQNAWVPLPASSNEFIDTQYPKMDISRQDYDFASSHQYSFMVPSYQPYNHSQPQIFNVSCGLNKDQSSFLEDGCHNIEQSTCINSVQIYKPHLIHSESSNQNENSSMTFEGSITKYQQTNGVTTSHASWDGVVSSNDSCLGTINGGDDISSVCKPVLCDQKHRIKVIAGSSNNHLMKDDLDYDVSRLSRKQHWSFPGQWSIDTLISHCDTYS
ncbi:hypothetical protein KP509_17G059200 [Ceratopteris richardii]|uniref:Uncharacterized protein n=1 Tax=Ceratopteris richardii TaxID=49495 RepID=A0A8T2SWK0_CERRI|nr:hypothetical protein KP509_17G059200 [Ceratopteris richardii]